MSLKAFHVIFITASSLMLFGFAAWMLREYRGPEGVGSDLALAVAGIVSGVGLLVYEGFFLRKMRNISYL